MTLSNKVVTETVDGCIRVVTINRPERRNALDEEAIEGLIGAFVDAGDDTDVRVVVLRGAGDHAFCAGRDLKEMHERASQGSSYTQPMGGRLRNVHEVVFETSKPTIAALNGPAVAGGCELALACDLRIAVEGAYFQLTEALRGMGANFASVLLPQLIPRAVAMEMLYMAAKLSAAEAARWGLVNRVVSVESFDDEVLAMARVIAASAPLSVGRYSATARQSWGVPPAVGFRLNAGPNPYQSEDRAEGVRAYLEGRAPIWKGR